MRVQCTNCGATGSVDEAKIPNAGAKIKCPQCGERFSVKKEPRAVGKVSEAPGPSLEKSPAPFPPKTPSEPGFNTEPCSVCKKSFSRMDLVRLGDAFVCAGCKPGYMQMLQQGLPRPGHMQYGGFWIRFGAKMLDGILVLLIDYLMAFPLRLLLGPPNPDEMVTSSIIRTLVQVVIGVSYSTFFVGMYRATPGKMACGLVIVTAEGGRVSYWRAFGRHFAEALSGMILAIGYIMAAFDDEKRTLHDRICNTRVIKK